MSTGVKQVIVVRKDLNMRKGKIAAQVANAAMMFLIKPAEVYWATDTVASFKTLVTPHQHAWLTGSFTKVVPYCNSEAELRDLIQKARDAGVVVHE